MFDKNHNLNGDACAIYVDGPAMIWVNIYLRTISRIDDVKMVSADRQTDRQTVKTNWSFGNFPHVKELI